MNLPQGSYDDESITPAWLPIQNQDGQPLKPIIRCACGDLLGMGLHHVHPDGRVTASFYHHWDPGTPAHAAYGAGCGFHAMLDLDGYATDPQYAGREFLPEPR